jgi:hypothetical protein
MIEEAPFDRHKNEEFPPWCHIEHFRLSDAPPYQALSYAWGKSTTKSMFLNRHKINIRRNLWKALWHLRYMGFHSHDSQSDPSNQSDLSLHSQESEQASKGSITWFWVDALCIDQQNVAERNHQVRVMGKIYRMAKEVFVWLGCVEDVCQAEVREEDEQIDGESIYEALCDIKRLSQDPNHGPKLINNLTQGIAISGFAGLLRGVAYWRRMWIVQEIGLASKITLFFDEVSTSWESFQAFRDLLDSHGMHYELARYSRFAHDIEAFRKCQACVLDSHRRATRRNGLADWIESCQDCNCHDPKDKVYGLLGLANDCQDESRNVLEIDYSRSLFEVYSDVIDFYQATKRSRRGPSQHVIRFSQVLQQSFNRPNEIDAGARAYISGLGDAHNPLIHVFGLMAGTVERIGLAFDSNDLFKSLCNTPMMFPHCRITRSHVLGDMGKIVPTKWQASFAVQGKHIPILKKQLSILIPYSA